MTHPPLTEEARAVLAFAKLRWKYLGAKETAIRDQFDCSPAVYYGRLNRLLDDPAALAAEPQLVRRLIRLRERRRQHRSNARVGSEVTG